MTDAHVPCTTTQRQCLICNGKLGIHGSSHESLGQCPDCVSCCLLSHLQTAIIQLYLKRRHRLTDTAFDALCKFNHASHSQGPDNYYPRSLWLMKKVVGVADARSVQVGQHFVIGYAWQLAAARCKCCPRCAIAAATCCCQQEARCSFIDSCTPVVDASVLALMPGFMASCNIHTSTVVCLTSPVCCCACCAD